MKQRKCSPYWPEEPGVKSKYGPGAGEGEFTCYSESSVEGPIKVKLLDKSVNSDYILNRLLVTRLDKSVLEKKAQTGEENIYENTVSV